jgi:cell division septal protein FtsQ
MDKTKRNKIIISMLFVIIALVIAMIVFFAQDWSAKKSIKSIEVSGIALLDEDEITSKVKPFILNIKKEEIKLSAISDSLKENQYVKEAYVSMSSSEKIRIEIVERNPLAYLVADDGSLVYTDEDMAIFDYRHDKMSDDIPVIRNVLRQSLIDTTALMKAFRIIADMKAEIYDVYKDVSEIIFDINTNGFEIFLSDSGKKILFGDVENSKQKIRKMNIIMDMLNFDQKFYNSKYIDIRWKGQIIASS